MNSFNFSQPLFSPNTVLGSAEAWRERNKLARRFLVDVFSLENDDLPIVLPESETVFEQVRVALSHLERHARTTLMPTSADSLQRYENSVEAALRKIQALKAIYIEGLAQKDLKGADGDDISATSQALLIKSARPAMRSILSGDPAPGWMDGRPIDELRATVIDLLPESATAHVAHALDEREKFRDSEYDLRDVSVSMLPFAHETKRRLQLAGYSVLGTVMSNLTLVRGIDKNSELPLVVSRLSEHDPVTDSYAISPEWLGDE